MVISLTGRTLNGLSNLYRHITGFTTLDSFIQVRNYAARKGTRERKAKLLKAKKKAKKVVEKVGYIPAKQRKAMELQKMKAKALIVRPSEDHLEFPHDNVYFKQHYKWKLHTVEEAVKNHRQVHHPTMINLPNAFVKAYIELDMMGDKKKLLDEFNRLVYIEHPFDHGAQRKILAFTKNLEDQNQAKAVGAIESGGTELIKSIQAGEFVYKDYDYFIADANILPELLPIRGVLKRKFPNAKTGTLGTNIKQLVTKFVTGISYTATKHLLKSDYGIIDVPFGTLNMDIDKLEKNLILILKDVLENKPQHDGLFITRVCIRTAGSCENFKLNLDELLESTKGELKAKEDDNIILSSI